MQHNVTGEAILTPRSLIGPRETTIADDIRQRARTNLYVFTDEKAKNCTLTLAANASLTSGASPALPNKISYGNHLQNGSLKKKSFGFVRHTPSPILEDAPGFQASTQTGSKFKDVNDGSRPTSRQTGSAQLRNRPQSDSTAGMSQNKYNTSIVKTPSLGDTFSETTPFHTKAVSRSFSSGQYELQKFTAKKRTAGITTQMATELDLSNKQSTADLEVSLPKTVTPIVLTGEQERSVNMKRNVGLLSKSPTVVYKEKFSPDSCATTVTVNNNPKNNQMMGSGGTPNGILFAHQNEDKFGGSHKTPKEEMSSPYSSGYARSSARTSLNDVTLADVMSPEGSDCLGIQSPQFTSSPINAQENREQNIYTHKVKEYAPETAALYNTDIDLI